MARHQAPTAVTIAPLAEASPLERAVKRYWMPIAALLLLVVAWILWGHNRQQRHLADREASWAALVTAIRPLPTGLPGGEPAMLQEAVTNTKDTAAAPWARLIHARALVEERRYDEALLVLDQLERDPPRHAAILTSERLSLPEGEHTLVEAMRKSIQDMRSWEAAHPELFGLPEPPPDAPRVRFHTSTGSFLVALYRDRAPEHVETFLRLASEGFYDGTRFHKVGPGFVQGGDPKSKDAEHPEEWGTGGEEVQLSPAENDLAHFAGALSAGRSADGRTDTAQFLIIHSDSHQLDEKHTVFGRVVEGLDMVGALAGQPLAEGSTDRPAEPVVLERVEVL